MYKVLFSLILLLPAATALSANYDGRLLLKNVRVIDGDTVDADITLPYGISLPDQRIRDATYDAWESKRFRRTVIITEEELIKGKKAAKALTQLLVDGDVYVTPVAGKDAYGRKLGKLTVVHADKTTDVAEWMIKNGHDRRKEKTSAK